MSSTIADAKAALVTILSAALPASSPFEASQVLVGPVAKTTLKPRVLTVGGLPNGDGESIQLEVQPTNLAGTTGTETFTLTLTASVLVAGTDPALAETRAVADFRAAVAAIQADGSLGGLDNLNASVSGQGDLFETADERGRSAAVRFPVVIFAAN